MTGQDLIDRANYRLAGYQNSVDSLALLDFLNEACNEVWVVIKSDKDDDFLQFSQNTNPNGSYYFPPLVPGTREYTLPLDFQEMRYIEVTSPGYTDTDFVFRSPTHEDFRTARRLANQNVNGSGPNTLRYYYTVIGANTLSLADYLPTTIAVTLWYVRKIPQFEPGDNLVDILTPFVNKAVDYAVKKVMLANQDSGQFEAWKGEWREDLIMISQGAAPRNQSDPTFVMGMDE